MSASMRGYTAHPRSSATSGDDSFSAGHTKGQLTMKDPCSPSNRLRLAFSFAVGSPAPPSRFSPIRWSTSAAARPASESMPSSMSFGGASGVSRISPPAEAIRAFTQTVRDSASAPWTPSCRSFSSATSMIWSHVTGSLMSRPASSTTDSRYQSSWVFAQNGTVTSSSFQLAESTAPCTMPSVSCSSSGTGARKPGSASSGMKGGSRLMMSRERSLAASRRASCSRCDAASRGSSVVSMRYAPSAASVQEAAMRS